MLQKMGHFNSRLSHKGISSEMSGSPGFSQDFRKIAADPSFSDKWPILYLIDGKNWPNFGKIAPSRGDQKCCRKCTILIRDYRSKRGAAEMSDSPGFPQHFGKIPDNQSICRQKMTPFYS